MSRRAHIRRTGSRTSRVTAPHSESSVQTRLGRALLLAGVATAVLAVPLSAFPWGMNPFGPAKLLSLAVAAACVSVGLSLQLESAVRQLRSIKDSRLVWALGAYGAVAVLSTTTSVDRFHSVVGSYPEYQGILTLALWAVIAIGAAALSATTEGRQIIPRLVITALCVVAAVAWLQKLGVPTVGGVAGWTKRAWSTVGNSSHLGVWLCLAIPFSVERFFADTRAWWRATALISGVLGLGALAWSGSRGALVGMVASALVGAMLLARHRPAARRVSILAGSAALVTSAVVLALMTQSRFPRLADFLDVSAGSAGWRFVLWRTALRIAGDRPFLGWGLNTMRFVYPSYRSAGALDSPVTMGTVADMHNLVLNTAASMGMAGIAALAACLFVGGSAVWRLSAAGRDESTVAVVAGAALTGFVSAVMFHYPALDSGALAAVVLGTLVAADIRGAQTSAPTPAHQEAGRPSDVTALAISAAGSALLIATVVATSALASADAAAARALSTAQSGAPWSSTRALLVRAQSFAPWEIAYRKTWASAGIASMRSDNLSTITPDVAQALDAAARMAPLDSSVLGGRGDVAVQAAKTGPRSPALESAEAAYRKALELDPNNAVYWAGIGTVQHARKQYPQAVTTFERVVTLAPESAEMWGALAQAYTSAGRVDDARNANAKAHDLARR